MLTTFSLYEAKFRLFYTFLNIRLLIFCTTLVSKFICTVQVPNDLSYVISIVKRSLIVCPIYVKDSFRIFYKTSTSVPIRF